MGGHFEFISEGPTARAPSSPCAPGALRAVWWPTRYPLRAVANRTSRRPARYVASSSPRQSPYWWRAVWPHRRMRATSHPAFRHGTSPRCHVTPARRPFVSSTRLRTTFPVDGLTRIFQPFCSPPASCVGLRRRACEKRAG